MNSLPKSRVIVGSNARRIRFSVSCVALAMILLACLPGAGQAQSVYNWTGTSNFWHSNSAWDLGGPPTNNAFAEFNVAATNTVSWNATTGNRQVGFLFVNAGDYTFENTTNTQYSLTFNAIGGGGFQVTGPSTFATIRGLHFNLPDASTLITGGATLNLQGHVAGTRLTTKNLFTDGQLNVSGGATIKNFGHGSIGHSLASTGVATVSGTGSVWENDSYLNVGNGNGASGTLRVQAGGVVSNTDGFVGRNTGSTGAVAVTGSGSQWNSSNLYLGGDTSGNGGSASLTINNTYISGASVNVGNDHYTNAFFDALTVSDTGSNGLMVVRNGATITNSGNGIIGNSLGKTGLATVTGTGSQWSNSEFMQVGRYGNGTLNVQAGGMVSSRYGSIGTLAGSTGEATVTGIDSLWNSSEHLSVGHYGNGTLNVDSGGFVSSIDGYIGTFEGATGVTTVTGSGSHWNISERFFVGYYGNGTLNVYSGGQVTNQVGNIGNYAGSMGVATVTGSGSQWNSSRLFLGFTQTVNGGSASLMLSDNGQVNVGNDHYANSGSALTVSDNGAYGILYARNAATITNSGFGLIGNSAGSAGVATVTGVGTQWNNASEMNVGFDGNGTLNVQAGGLVSNTAGYIGRNYGSTGVANVTGSGSRWNSSRLFLSGDDTVNGGAASLFIQSNGMVNVGDDPGTGPNGGLTVSDSGADGILYVRNGATITNSGDGVIGNFAGSTGVATVTGLGSQWNNDSEMNVGLAGTGTLDVQGGGLVSNAFGYVGRNSGSTGVVTVSDYDSRWNNSRLFLGGTETTNGGSASLWISINGQVNVGNDLYGDSDSVLSVSDTGANGVLFVRNAAMVSNSGSGFIGNSSGSIGAATVTGSGSHWNNASEMNVGFSGNGTLNVLAGGLVTNNAGYVGRNSGSVGVASVNGYGSQWNNVNSDLYVGFDGNGTLNVQGGGLVDSYFGYVGLNAGSMGAANVTGSGSHWNNIATITVGDSGQGMLNIADGGLVNSIGAYVGLNSGSTGMVSVTGSGSRWNNASVIYVGSEGQGTLNVQAGGRVENKEAWIGNGFASTGVVTVTGNGSQWNFLPNGYLALGGQGHGTLNVMAGGVVNSNYIAQFAGGSGAMGVATVNGSGSRWNHNGSMNVGGDGQGTLNVEAGGFVGNIHGTIGNGNTAGQTSTVTVTGNGSHWDNSGFLFFGGGSATLNVADQGLVTVGEGIQLTSGSTVNLNDGELRGHQFVLNDGVINNSGGTIHLDLEMINHVGGLVGGYGQFTADGGWNNSGIMSFNGGNSSVFGTVNNAGLIDVFNSTNVNFGDELVSQGVINNAGGTIHLDAGMTNQAGGLVGGYGQFAADGGWKNEGVLSFAGGNSNVFGDVDNTSVINILNGTQVDFGDDLIQNGMLQIERVGNSVSEAVVHGAFSGTGGFFGGGIMTVEGSLRPGNSPASVLFDGDLTLTGSARTFIELGGVDSGEFDQLLVGGNLDLGGSTLSVSIWNSPPNQFQLSDAMQFLIADVEGSLTGTFAGLAEGSKVARFGSYDLFITYGGIDGNAGVGLFSVYAVPEPQSFTMLLGVVAVFLLRRKRMAAPCISC